MPAEASSIRASLGASASPKQFHEQTHHAPAHTIVEQTKSPNINLLQNKEASSVVESLRRQALQAAKPRNAATETPGKRGSSQQKHNSNNVSRTASSFVNTPSERSQFPGQSKENGSRRYSNSHQRSRTPRQNTRWDSTSKRESRTKAARRDSPDYSPEIAKTCRVSSPGNCDNQHKATSPRDKLHVCNVAAPDEAAVEKEGVSRASTIRGQPKTLSEVLDKAPPLRAKESQPEPQRNRQTTIANWTGRGVSEVSHPAAGLYSEVLHGLVPMLCSCRV